MLSATTPKQLMTLCRKLKTAGAVGCLISGGCNPEGFVPLEDFTQTIAQIKRELNFNLAVHIGLIQDAELAKELKEAGIDSALLDVMGAAESLKEIYHLDLTLADVERSLRTMHAAGLPLVPHILVGLHRGKLLGEFKAVELVARYKPRAVVIITLIPLDGTPMWNMSPPTPEDVINVLTYARRLLPSTPLALGCARPLREHRVKTDCLAVEAGVNAIAFPSEAAVELAGNLGLKVKFSCLCCAQIHSDITRGR